MRSYLGGALTVEELGRDAGAGLFRAEDARGQVAWLTRGEPADYVHVVEFRASGDRRGFHFHTGFHERLYVVSGSLRLIASFQGERIELQLTAGSLVGFAPGVAHGFIAETPALTVAFGSGTDPIRDTTPVPDLS